MYLRRPGRRRLLTPTPLPSLLFLTFLVLLSSSLVVVVEALSWPPVFRPKRFRGNSLISAGSLGISGDGTRVVAFGDFNGDQSLDVLVLNSDQQTLTVYYWNHETFSFTPSKPFKHPNKVVNVIPGDFTHSGKLDLLVASQNRDILDLVVYPSLVGNGFDVDNPITIPSSTHSQPIPIDINGDMKIDLMGMTSTSRGRPDSAFQVWRNVWNASADDKPTLFQLEDAPFNGTQCTISDPHSNAVIDLNGDCLADVFLTCDDGHGGKKYQIWVNEKEKGFTLSQQGQLPAGTQAISFADINRDGTMDMIFPTCTHIDHSTGIGTDCFINIAYNQQLGTCSSSTESGIQDGVRVCRRPQDLCTADPNFKFDLDGDNAVRFPVSSILPSSVSSSLLVYDTSFSPVLPIPLKLGDANLDGFPDMLVIGVEGRNERIPRLVYSVPCDGAGAGAAGCSKSSGHGRRGWKMASKGVELLGNVKDARSLSFMDMDEDGTLDIMVQRTGQSGEGTILFVQNNFYYDAFFLKAIVLNGACDNGWCFSPNGSIRYHPIGASSTGATFKYTVLDTAGRRSAAQVGQLSQACYHSLETPYSFFGLGRTNNYIENLFVGTTIHGDGDGEQHYINMEGVIPNSKVVILPSVKGAWKEELFLRPGEWIPWVTLTVVVGMVVLAVIVFVLHLNEKREDELERRRISHHINFDAL